MAKKKKRDAVYLQYACKDGSRTVANTASIGLMHWYGRITPQTPIENPQPFEVYVVKSNVPSPYHPMFFALVIAGLERTFGCAPELPAHLLDPAHVKRFGEKLEARRVEEHLKTGTPEVVEYEQACLNILQWLKERGEITMLAINEPMKPLDW